MSNEYLDIAMNKVIGQEVRNVLQEIKREIEGNMESIIGKYDSSTPTRNMPSAKIERNEGRKDCLAIIDKYTAQYKEDAG